MLMASLKFHIFDKGKKKVKVKSPARRAEATGGIRAVAVPLDPLSLGSSLSSCFAAVSVQAAGGG